MGYGFSSSADTLVYAHGGSTETRLVTVDRQGRRLEMPDISGEINGFALAPDQSRVAFERRDPTANTVDVWVADLTDGVEVRIANGNPWAGTPLWSPDSERILFTDWTGDYSIRETRTDEIQKVESQAHS